MNYINTETLEYPLTLRQVRQAVPNVSLPKEPDEATLNALGFATVQPKERPVGDVVTEGAPEKQSDGTWRQTWNTRPYTDTERAEALERAKVNKQEEINAAYQTELDAILKQYPDTETKTWDKQEQEARTYLADSSVSTPLLSEIASARGMDKAELVQRVIAKADAWIALSGAATGKRQALEDAIASTESLEAVDAISW